jgi:hypothetical protein
MFGASPACGGLLTGLNQVYADQSRKTNNLTIGSLSIGRVKASSRLDARPAHAKLILIL